MRVIVAHAVPSPRLRNATTKLHTASMTESNSPGRSLPSWRPMIVGISRACIDAMLAASRFARLHHPCVGMVGCLESLGRLDHPTPAGRMYSSASAP